MSLDSSSENDSTTNENNENNNIWNPQLRRVMGTLSGIGMIETAYLTFVKLTSAEPVLCSTGGSCGDVLNGPYASVGDIPLSAFGLAAYTCVTALSFYPVLVSDDDSKTDDSFNRLALVSITSAMATFSAFLLSLLLSILHESCPYCFVSAGLSLTLALLAWFGGAAEDSKSSKTWPIAQSGLSSVIATTVASVAFYFSIDGASTMSASAKYPDMPPGGYSPPPITTTSSPESIQLAQKLNDLHAQMFGAYWCSHCYEQKQTLGAESMKLLPYVECSKEGKNSQTPLCKEKDVPGYPTWVINGKLYPGQQTLEELQEIVDKTLASK